MHLRLVLPTLSALFAAFGLLTIPSGAVARLGVIDPVPAATLGFPVFGNQCLGLDVGSGVATGFVTIDVVSRCSVDFPGDIGYFGGVAIFENRILGEYTIHDPAANSTRRYLAAHIEADPTGTVYSSGDRTFYGHLVNGDASDRREPLPTTFATRFNTSSGDTDIHVWRESVDTHSLGTITCGTAPAVLAQNDLLVFNESEELVTVPLALPWATQRFSVGATGVVPLFGWLQLDERHAENIGLYGDDLAQAWVNIAVEAGGFVTTQEAIQLDGPVLVIP